MYLIFQFRYVFLALPHCHFSFVKFYIELNVYGKYCSLQRWQENHEALKFKRSCLRGKGTSYSIMLFLKKSTTKDTGYLSEMITAVYTDRRQKQIWHFNLNIQNGWSCGTCLPLSNYSFSSFGSLLQFGMLHAGIGCAAPHISISDIWLQWGACGGAGTGMGKSGWCPRRGCEILCRDKKSRQTQKAGNE